MECEEYCGDSEVEPDSDHEEGGGAGEDHWPPPPPHAGHVDLDSYETGTVRRRTKTIVTPKMAMESFRLSFLNDDQDVNFDAILGELYELESQLNTTQTELSRSLGAGGGGSHPPPPAQFQDEDENSASTMAAEREELDRLAAEITSGLQYSKTNGHHHHAHTHPHAQQHPQGGGGGGGAPFPPHPHHHGHHPQHITVAGAPPLVGGGEGTAMMCDVADTDSAFSDNASLPSSESFTSMVTVSSSAETNSSSSGGDTCSMSSALCAGLSQAEEEQIARLKAEKIRIALEKIKDAKIRKLFVRAFAKDGSSKSILVDEKMSVGQVCSQLADKNHVRLNHNLAVVEHMPELLMERILEDHDSLVENMVMWTRDSKNKIMFEERYDKYDLFRNPEKYLLSPTTAKPGPLTPQQKDKLIQDFFGPESPCTPQMEGALYLKSDGKKAWKKFFFVLRASGLYYNPKGKATKNPKDLVCLVQFEFVEVYKGIGWKKKYHAPSDFCFALKHPQIQKKTSKYIRYFCADSDILLDQWLMGIRIVKLGKQMLHNYERLTHEISMWDMRQPEGGAGSMEPDETVVKMLNHADLSDSRMSVPEPGSRHSVIQGSLVRNSTGYGTEVRDAMSIEVLAIPPRKGTDSVSGSMDGRSLSGSVGSSSLGSSVASESGHKTPVKRVSFSATHSIINGDSGEQQTVKHRDSIISASTDSSEDSNSSGGSGEVRLGASFRASKMRARLPLTTETTRQLADMCNVTVDEAPEAIYAETPHHHHRSGSSSSSSTTSSSTNFSRTDRRRASMQERRGSCGSGGSVDNSSRHSQIRSTPPTQKQHSLDVVPGSKSSGMNGHGQGSNSNSSNGHVRRKSEPLVGALLDQAQAVTEENNPVDQYAHGINGAVYNDPTYSTVYASSMKEEPKPRMSASPEPLYNQIQSPRMSGKVKASPPRDPAIPPPPQFREEDELEQCRQVMKSHEPSPPLPPPPNTNISQTPPPTAVKKGSMQIPPPPPPAIASKEKKPSVASPLPAQANQQHKSSPPPTLPKPNNHSSSTAPTQAPPPPPPSSSLSSSSPSPKHPSPKQASTNSPSVLPKQPPPPPLRMVSNESTTSTTSGANSCSGSPLHVPMPPPMAPITPKLPPPPTMPKTGHASMTPPSLLASSPSSLKSQPSTPSSPNQVASPHNKKGGAGKPSVAPPTPPSNTSSLPKNNRHHSVSSEDGPPQSPSLPFLSELSKRSQADSLPGSNPHPTPTGQQHTPTSVTNQQHRRSASAGGNGGSTRGVKAPPPPPPKRSENTRLSSEVGKPVSPLPTADISSTEPVPNGKAPNQQDPIYQNYDGIMDIDQLPPPPPELLEGLGQSGKKGKPPPPPPKRSKDTQLSTV